MPQSHVSSLPCQIEVYLQDCKIRSMKKKDRRVGPVTPTVWAISEECRGLDHPSIRAQRTVPWLQEILHWKLKGAFFQYTSPPYKNESILSSGPTKNRALNLETIFSAERRVGMFIQPSPVWVFIDEEKRTDIYLDQLLLEAYLRPCLSRLTCRNSERRYFSSSHHGQPGCGSHRHLALDQLCSRVETSLIL